MSTSFIGEVDRRDRFVVVSNPNQGPYFAQVQIAGTIVDILGIRNVRPKRLEPPSLEDRVEPIVFLADVHRILEGLIQQKRLSEELIEQVEHVKKTLYEEQTSLETLFSVAGESLIKYIKSEIPIWWKVYERNEQPVLFLESLIYGPRKPIPPMQRVIDALKKYLLIEKILRVANKTLQFPPLTKKEKAAGIDDLVFNCFEDAIFWYTQLVELAESEKSFSKQVCLKKKIEIILKVTHKALQFPPLTEEEKAAGIDDLVSNSFEGAMSWYRQLMELELSARSSLEQVCLQNKLEIIFTLNGLRVRLGSSQIHSSDLAELYRETCEMLLNPAYFFRLSDQEYEALLNLIEIDLALILELEKEDYEVI